MYPSIVLLVLVCLSSVIASPNPGIAIRASQKGLDYAASMSVAAMAGKVKGQHIPDQSDISGIYIGNFNWYTKDMDIKTFTEPASYVTLSPGEGVSWVLTGAAASMYGDWGYTYLFFSGSGNIDITVSGVSLTVSAVLGRSADGHPTITASACTCTIDKVKVTFHGGASWLYNMFSNTVANKVKHSLQNKLCSAANESINQDAAREFATMKMSVKINEPLMEGLILDYSLVAPPIITSTCIELPLKGEIYYQSPQPCPLTPPALTMPPLTKMAGLAMSEYVLNSAGYALQTHGALTYILTKKDLPASERDILNVACDNTPTCIGALIPQLKTMFGDGSVEVGLVSSEPPTLQISSNLMTGEFTGQATISVRLKDDQLKFAFTGLMNITLNLTAHITDCKVIAKVISLVPTINVTRSDIGDIPTGGLSVLLTTAAGFIVRNLNDIGAMGLVLPSLGHARLVSPLLTLEQNTLNLDSDLVYHKHEWD